MYMNISKRNFLYLVTIFMLMILFSYPVHSLASGKGDVEGSDYTNEVSLDDLAGKRAGVITGTPQDQMVKDSVKNAELYYFDTFSDMALALKSGKIDFFVNSTIAYRMMKDTYPGYIYVNDVVRSFEMGAIFPQTEKGKELCDQFNSYVNELKENGSLDAMKEYWLFPNDWKNFKIPKKGVNGTLTFATCSSNKPFAMLLNEDYAGFDVAVVAGFCQEYGYGMAIEDTNFAGILAGISSGKYDLAAGQISWTEERAQSVLYSDLYCDQDIVPIINASDWNIVPTGQDSKGGDSFWQNLVSSFHRTFIEQSRWKAILGGFKTTILITLFGFLLANVLGALFCMMSLSQSRILHFLADFYSALMQGLPMVVILMILYYVIFGGINISGVLVAIIGFGITSGAYLAQIFYGSITGIEPGQWEASLALGFTKREAFRKIILPQAVRSMLPGYFSQIISLMKGTAIVGYIAVIDLTKAGDIVRSTTYEAFFPLISVALIYFAVAGILLLILKMIQKKLAPKRVNTSSNKAFVSDNKGGRK